MHIRARLISLNTAVHFVPVAADCLCRKYNSLIQAQARELSHLRQRMREGQGVCHILTQHLGDTTKVLQTHSLIQWYFLQFINMERE